MTQMLSLFFVLAIMGFSEIVSKLTKGKIPSALILALGYIIGFWTVLPSDIVQSSGISTMYTICTFYTITSMATKIPVGEMKRQWKTIIIAIMGVLGICLTSFTIGVLCFGSDLVLSTVSAFAGGSGALVVMQQAAEVIGRPEVAVAALIAGNAQILIGYPLTGVVLRREARRLDGLYSKGELSALSMIEDGDRYKFKPFKKLEKYSSPTIILLKLTFIAVISLFIEQYTGLNRLVSCLIIGFLATVSGFLEDDALARAKADGICMTFMLAYLFGLFSATTPSIFFSMFFKILVLAVISTLGMYIMAYASCRIFKGITFDMCMGIILTCYHGFPVNIMLTEEAVDSVIADEKEKTVIKSQLIPKMLVGGFTSVTFVSVLLASVCASILGA